MFGTPKDRAIAMVGTALRDVAELEAYQLCESTPRCLVEAIAAGIAILAQ